MVTIKPCAAAATPPADEDLGTHLPLHEGRVDSLDDYPELYVSGYGAHQSIVDPARRYTPSVQLEAVSNYRGNGGGMTCCFSITAAQARALAAELNAAAAAIEPALAPAQVVTPDPAETRTVPLLSEWPEEARAVAERHPQLREPDALCQTCRGSGSYRPAYSSGLEPCPDCRASAQSSANTERTSAFAGSPSSERAMEPAVRSLS